MSLQIWDDPLVAFVFHDSGAGGDGESHDRRTRHEGETCLAFPHPQSGGLQTSALGTACQEDANEELGRRERKTEAQRGLES